MKRKRKMRRIGESVADNIFQISESSNHGRWNKDTKKVAIELIKQRHPDAYIAPIVGMSIHSVCLLRYSVVQVNTERITCLLCLNKFKQITERHLKSIHGLSTEDYKKQFPTASTCTTTRLNRYRAFKHPNKGKTYDQIYGTEEGLKKRSKISQKQIGRPASPLAGTGITGTRKDTGAFARSTYEANIDRIFLYEKKPVINELDKSMPRFDLVRSDGITVTYRPDRIDSNGLFKKNAILEIKGYLYPEDAEKIRLFRQQFSAQTLLVISPDSSYADISYSELENKYRTLIPLWETSAQNFKTRPDIYDPRYIEPGYVQYLRENYPNGIHKSITKEHYVFIAKKCLSFNRVRLGKKVHVGSVDLIAISDRRPNSTRTSSGEFHYELWRIYTAEKETFYVTNQSKTIMFYCYVESDLPKISQFFNHNNNSTLTPGHKLL